MNKIKFYRKQIGLTVRALADKAEVAVGYVSDLENETELEKNPSRDVMVKISDALGKTVPDVFFPESKEKEAV